MKPERSPAVLKALGTLFQTGTLGHLSDEDLLERFSDQQEELAFEVLVKRHGPMVLRVCRSILGNVHDAQDAFQATFLILATRADSIRWRRSLASWLFGVARRVATRSQREDARRREHERLRAEQLVISTSNTSSELLPEVLEEVDRLPERLRAAVVLCYLEGHTYGSAADQVGCRPRTIQSRLLRARERLRRRLTRRGLAPDVAVFGAAATERIGAATVPAELTGGLVRVAAKIAAGETVPTGAVPEAFRLASVMIRSMIVSRMIYVATGVLALGFTAAGLSVWAWQPGPQPGVEPASKPRPIASTPSQPADAVPDEEPEPKKPVHTLVVDQQGNPIENAHVHAYLTMLQRSTFETDEHGRVEIPADRLKRGSVILAEGPDGEPTLGWARFMTRADGPSGTEDEPLRLTLFPLSQKVSGTLVGPSGEPVEGVRVMIQFLTAESEILFHPFAQVGWPIAPVLTDELGQFEIIVPAGTTGSLLAEHPYLDSYGLRFEKSGELVEPRPLVPGGRIEGKVIDARTGEPVEGVVLGAQNLEYGTEILGNNFKLGRTDANGRYEIPGLQPGVYNVLFQAAEGRPEASAVAVEAVRVRVGEDTTANLELVEGRLLEGVVLGRQSNTPIAQVDVGYYGTARPRSGAARLAEHTDESGRFRFIVPPGSAYLYIGDSKSLGRDSSQNLIVPEEGEIELVRLIGRSVPAPPSETMYMVQEDAANRETEETDAPTPDAEADLRSLRGRVLDEQGRPFVGVSLGPDGPLGHQGVRKIVATDREGVFELDHLSKNEVRLRLWHPTMSSSKIVVIPAGVTEIDLVLPRPDALP